MEEMLDLGDFLETKLRLWIPMLCTDMVKEYLRMHGNQSHGSIIVDIGRVS